jgi:hypothetical protein
MKQKNSVLWGQKFELLTAVKIKAAILNVMSSRWKCCLRFMALNTFQVMASITGFHILPRSNPAISLFSGL